MLLEMDRAALQQLLSDRTMLEVAVRKAQAALDTQSWTLSTWTEEDNNISPTEEHRNKFMTDSIIGDHDNTNHIYLIAERTADSLVSFFWADITIVPF